MWEFRFDYQKFRNRALQGTFGIGTKFPVSCGKQIAVARKLAWDMVYSDTMNLLTLLVSLLPIVGACSHNVFSPPSRPITLTNPATLDKDETVVRATGSISEEILGPSIVAGSVGARHGIKSRVEVVADISYAQVVEESEAGTNRGIAMGRAGVKLNPKESNHVAVLAGIGGGYAPAGGAYTTADIGFAGGYENPYAIPFVNLGVFASIPLNPKEIDTTLLGSSEGHSDTPKNTFGVTMGAGVKVPINTSAVVFGVNITRLADDDTVEVFLGVGVGIETKL